MTIDSTRDPEIAQAGCSLVNSPSDDLLITYVKHPGISCPDVNSSYVTNVIVACDITLAPQSTWPA